MYKMKELINSLFKHKEVYTIIGKGDIIQGELHCSSLYVDGTIEGDNILNAKNIIVGQDGLITSKVQASNIQVYGIINGDIKADVVELFEGANVSGNIYYTTSLVINKSVAYSGTINHI